MDRTRSAAIVSLLALAALGACQRPAAKTDVSAAVAGAAQAQRKAGLWEERVSDGSAVQVTRICLDQTTDTAAALFGRQLVTQRCSQNAAVRQPDGTWKLNSVCEGDGGGQVTATGVASGDFTSRYQIRYETSAGGGAPAQRLVVDAAWQGACPTDMAPGDMQLPDGTRTTAAEIYPATK